MTLFLLAYLGGVLTIVSPCILPVLPFLFARADQPFTRHVLPMLAGLAVTFAGVATLAAVAGGWAVAANAYGRDAALALLGLFGLTLLFPALGERLTRPLVALGNRLSSSGARSSSWPSSLLLGGATGLLWAPCAGPVLGLILTGAALSGANARTALLLLAFALGAATSLALALLVGGRVLAAMKRSLGAGEWIRRGLGALVLIGVTAIAFGVDTGFLSRLSLAGTTSLEQGLLDRLRPEAMDADQAPPAMAMSGAPAMMMAGPASGPASLPAEGAMPRLSGATLWLNSPPLTAEALKGKVVLIDFWTYSCINCLRTIPYVRAWAEKYRDHGLVVIGVHAPEFAFEKSLDNVRGAVASLKIGYPVAVDNDYAIWRAFHNQYWPAHYFIDADGQIRHHHFGEGEQARSERVIQQLLAEAGQTDVPGGLVDITASGAEAAADLPDVQSPETYLGYARAEDFVSPGGASRDRSALYQPGAPRLNQWGLAGDWTVGAEHAVLDRPDGSVVYRFHARDLHLVLGPGADGRPVRFQVTLDGKAPGPDHGVDTDADGQGVVTSQRLYQLIRQTGPVTDHLFAVRFLDPGVQVFAFTFG